MSKKLTHSTDSVLSEPAYLTELLFDAEFDTSEFLVFRVFPLLAHFSFSLECLLFDRTSLSL
jgi:hypothetical protein